MLCEFLWLQIASQSKEFKIILIDLQSAQRSLLAARVAWNATNSTTGQLVSLVPPDQGNATLNPIDIASAAAFFMGDACLGMLSILSRFLFMYWNHPQQFYKLDKRSEWDERKYIFSAHVVTNSRDSTKAGRLRCSQSFAI